MAFGDIGGAVTELIITCQTPDTGDVKIERGDPVELVGPYTITNQRQWGVLFGQSMGDAESNSQSIPIKVRGVAIFNYEGVEPKVTTDSGLVMGSRSGKVEVPHGEGVATGKILKVNATDKEVHLLL